MRKRFCDPLVQPLCVIGFLAVFVSGGPAQASSDCERIVMDKASIFTQEQTHRVEQMAEKLRLAGADVHVLALSIPSDGNLESTSNIDSTVNAVLQTCPHWRSTGAELKENLILLAAAPKARATEIRFGSRWTSALSGSWQSVMSDDMNPLFRRGDIAGGFVAGEQRIAKEITPASPAQTPQAPVNAEVSDLTQNILQIMQWLFPLMILVAVIHSLSFFLGGQGGAGSSEQTTGTGTEDREREQKRAAECIASVRKQFAEYEALGGDRILEAKSMIDEATERYAKAVASCEAISAPSLAQSLQVAKEFKTISELAGKAQSTMVGVSAPIGSEWKPEYTQGTIKHVARNESSMAGSQATRGNAASAVVTRSPGSSDGGFVPGFLVGSLLSSHSNPTGADWSGPNSDDGSSSGSSSSSSDSGGSSDWGSSSSDGGSSNW